MLKITQDESYLDILKTYLENDETEIQEISIMAVSELPCKKSIDILAEKYYTTRDKSIKALILDSLIKIIATAYDLLPYFEEKYPDLYDILKWDLQKR